MPKFAFRPRRLPNMPTPMFFVPHLLVLALLLTSLVVKPSQHRWTIWPLIASLIYVIFFENPTNDKGGDASIRSSFISYLFVSSDYILLTDVQHELCLSGQREPISNASFGARLRWALRLFFGPRGVGWAHEPKGVLAYHPHLTRGRFVFLQLLRSAVYLVFIDVVHFLIVYTSVFAQESVPTALQAWHWRVVGVILLALRGFSYLSLMQTMLSIVCVGTGISEPKGWPPLFGKWGDAYTVRKFWGYAVNPVRHKRFIMMGCFYLVGHGIKC